MNKDELITKASITTSVCKIDLKDNNLVFIHVFEDSNIEIPEVDELNKNLRSLVGDELCYIIVFPGSGSTSSQEARKYAAKLKGKNIVAEAIVVTNLAIRLLANFYIKVNRPTQKIKLFSNEASALDWINSLQNKNSSQSSKKLLV